MPSVDSDKEGDIFFDACDDIRSSTEASSSVGCSTSDQVSATWTPEYELWTREPMSVNERRQRFLKGMGFAESIPTETAFSHWQEETIGDCIFRDLEERISTICSSFRSSFSSASDSAYCIRDLDTGNRFIVHEIQQDGLTGILEEVGTNKLMVIKQSESFLSFCQLVHKFLQKGGARSPARGTNMAFNDKEKDPKSFCGRFSRKKGEARICMSDVHMKSLKTSTFFRTKVDQQNKKWMDFSAVYMCQEIQAHGGSIRVMKFSPSGLYLASVGEDNIMRIWMIREVESSPELYGREAPVEYMDRNKGLKMKLGESRSRTLAIIPKKVFNISETPLHEFHGHTSDILDMTWSKSDFLLTASKDRTVRMWRVGCDGCLAVFKHRDYVTCVQFNPVDERYFISGSIDRKVRVWDVSEKRVVDWDDTRDIITAVSYQPDGKGLIVGTFAGKCRFYDNSGPNMELKKVTRVKKKRSSGNQITGLQFSGDDPSRIAIASAGSKIRVSERAGITQKFEGRWGSRVLLPPSLTSDGRYLVSAGADSNVYIWNFDKVGGKSTKGLRTVSSCEHFFSEGVMSVATWPGLLHEGGGGGGGGGDLQSPENKGPALCRDRERCSFGTWFLADGMRGAATWPEEKLLPSLKYVNCAGLDDCRRKVSAAWNTVVLTGGRDGVIRCFHNYGLPVKL
ncbi:uncharacterized protein LOC133920519 [Phragmites australis]|uniref:uncharacterized protein LOC133920519 n=1 Tax=Phragmites australis TaxID=29695 RepID=UPI002D77B5AD|nr:uncharacterized protein LOC133920519 [Phragmites australis]